LAALKNQKFNFDFDADKIGRSFREANRQMQLKPRVDLSELHELNRLLDVKLNHVKKVQKYFDANPLRLSTKLSDPVFKIPTGTKSKGQSFSKENIDSGSNQVLEQLKQVNETLEEIRKNTGADIARGFKQEIGAQIFDQSFVKDAIEVGASSVKSAFKGTGKVIADSFIPKKVQSFFSVEKKASVSEGLPISDLLNSLMIFTEAVESSAKGVRYGAKSSVEFGRAISKVGGLLNFDVSGVVSLNKTANSVAKSMTDVIQKTSAFKSGLSDVITLGNNLNKLPLLLLIRSLDSLAKKSNIAGLNLESITRKGGATVSFIEALITVLKANTDSFQDLKSQATSTRESFKTVGEIADELKQPFESIAKQIEKISDRVDNLDSLLANLSVSIEKIVSLAKDLDTLQKAEIPFSPQAEMEPVEVATEDFAQAQEAIQSVVIEFAESVAKASDSLEILEDALSSLQSVGEIDVSVAMEDLRKTLTALNLDASKQRKKGEYAPDLRMVGQQLGVKTRNPATQKAFKKQELVDFIAENFQAKDIQKALETVQVKLPDIDPKALEDLSRWYDDIASKLKDIDNKPIEDQATIIEALQLAMQKAAKAIEYFEKSFTLGKESNQVLQGRKAAFHSLWKSTEKIKSSWKNTTDFVAGQIQDLEQISDDEGYKIQKNVSEGSPGITVEIRKNWEKTIDFVASQIQELTQKAKAEGMAVKEGMAAGLDESAISGLQQQFRETLKTIEQLKQSVPGLKELGIAIEEIEAAISGMSAEELKAEAEEIKQVVEQIGSKITETSGRLKNIVLPQPTTAAPSATKSAIPFDYTKELANNYKKTQVFVAAQLTALRDKSKKLDAEISQALKASDWLKASDLIAAQKKISNIIGDVENDFASLSNNVKMALTGNNTEESFKGWTEALKSFSSQLKSNEESVQLQKLRKEYRELEAQIKSAFKAKEWVKSSDLIAAQKAVQEQIDKIADKTKIEVQIELPDLDLKAYTEDVMSELQRGLSQQKPVGTRATPVEPEAQTMGVKAGNLRIIRKSWEGFRTIVKEITEDIQNITRDFVKDFDDLFKDFQWYQSLKEELQRAKIVIASSFDVALDAALETPIGQKVGGFVLEMANAFKEKVVPVATAISNGLKAAIAATTGIFDGLIDGFVETFKGDAFKKVASQIGEGLSTVLGKVGGLSAEQFYERFREGTSKLVQQISNTIFTGLSSAIEAMPQVLDALKTTFEGAQGFITNFFDNFKANIVGIAAFFAQAFVLTKLTQGMRALGQASFQTALEVEQLTRSLSFSSAEGGITTLDMIKQKAEELSLSFIEAAQGYSQLAASTLGTSLESQTEDIFTGVSTAIAARGLGKEQQSRAFLAISQVAAKGRVSLEELNGQLGEALPGALQTAARALGVTSAELIKLVSTGQVTADEFLPKFADQLALEAGSSVAAAANTATAQLVKFENRLTNIRAELGKGILTPLAAVLPIVNGALKILADNMTLVLGIVGSLSLVLTVSVGNALLVVASQLKLANLAAAAFGLTLEERVNGVTGKTSVAINGLGSAFKSMALYAAPLLILATVVSRIQAATKPLNEDIAKTNKEFVTAINNAKRLRAEREREKRKQEQEQREGKDKTSPLSDYQLLGELYGGKNQQRMLGIGVAVNKFLPFMQFGRSKEITQVAETFLDIQRQARLAREDIDLAIEGYSGLTEAQKQQLQENEKATRLKGTELQVASATGLDTTQLKADLEGLRQKREEILNTIQGYDELVAASNRVDASIENLNTRRENEQIDRQTYNEELARLTEQKERVSVLLDDYAEGTKQVTNNVRALASELQKVSVEFQNAQLSAERTASMAQMELIKGRLSGKVSAPEFARQQTAITNQQTTATKDAAIAARDTALKSIQSIDNTMLGLELETAFGDQLKTVLSNGTVEAVEAARERLSQGGKELDPAIETALNSIQEYIGLRNQAFELEKQTLEQQLDNRQQAADILQQEIDLLNERAQFEIDTKSLQAEIEQMRQMGAGMLSEFQAQQLSATQEATAKRRDAARLRTSASEAQLAAQNPDILPEARQRFLRDAQRQNLEAQLKEQEALYAESQARIARELRPLDLAKEQIDINLSAAQQQASVQMNRAMASSALSSFQKEMMQSGSAINQLLFEAQNESFLAQMERGKAGVKGLSPDKRKELLISAQQRENLAEQKRSEAELQQVELQRNKQIRDFELATKQAAIANDQFYQSRKNAILSEQANAKTVGDIATANIIAQKKQLDLEIEYTKRKLALNQQQLTSNENLYRRGIIDIDTYNENYSQLTTERLNLQESVTSQQIQLNQQEIDNFQKLAEQLKSVNSIREAVLEAQIKGQERATLATNVYSDALSKQGDLIQAQSKIRANIANKAILDAELAVSALNKQTEAEIAVLNQKKETATEAEKARIDAEIAKKEADTKAKVEQKSLEIAQEKARLLEQEQATQRKLLALEIERNKITAQQQIKEAEIGALRARNAVVAAQIAVKEKAATGNQDEIIQAQLGLELATEEFRVALGQIDINKQNAVITNQLAALQREGLLGEQNIERARQAGDFALQFDSASNPFDFGDGGFGFAFDPSVKALANMGNSLATVTDFSKYDALLSQLDRAAQPLEAQLSTQANAIKATNDLTGAITSLNEKITGLVTTLGRPNISVSGGSSISDAVELMRMTK
jgi:tape measure domain-containing protein